MKFYVCFKTLITKSKSHFFAKQWSAMISYSVSWLSFKSQPFPQLQGLREQVKAYCKEHWTLAEALHSLAV